MSRQFQPDDLVWAKFQNFRPWPGRIMRATINVPRGSILVQFFGNDDYENVKPRNVHHYLDRVEDFTRRLPRNNDIFYTALNIIHEKFWNLVAMQPVKQRYLPPIGNDDPYHGAYNGAGYDPFYQNHYGNPQAGPSSRNDERMEISDEQDDDDSDSMNFNSNSPRKKFKKAPMKSTSAKSTKMASKKAPMKSVASKSTKMESKQGKSNGKTFSAHGKVLIKHNNLKASSSKVISPKASQKIKKNGKSSCVLRSSSIQENCQKSEAPTKMCLRKRKISDQEEVTCSKEKKPKKNTEQEKVVRSEVISPQMKITYLPTPAQLAKASASGITKSPFNRLMFQPVPIDEVEIPKNTCDECNIKFGFIGIGAVSLNIIRALMETGHHVNVWSKDYTHFRDLAKFGAARTNTPAGIIMMSDVIVYTANDPDISMNLLMAKEGVYDGCVKTMGTPKIFVELSNIDVVEPDQNFKPLIHLQQGFYLQVKGLVPQMTEKTISATLMCAGNLRVFAEIAPCLNKCSEKVHYFGTAFFKDAPMAITPKIAEELVLQACQKTTSYLYDLGFKVPHFENIICDKNFQFGKIAAKVKAVNEEERKKMITFYADDM